MRDKIIRIEWTRAALIQDALKLPESGLPGLYYLTKVFGAKETSLYIGKASSSIRTRLNDHMKNWVLEYRGKIYVRMGIIQYPGNYDSEIIDHAESAIIYEHKKLLIENTDKKASYSYSDLYRIENTGDYFQLKKSIRMHNQ